MKWSVLSARTSATPKFDAGVSSHPWTREVMSIVKKLPASPSPTGIGGMVGRALDGILLAVSDPSSHGPVTSLTVNEPGATTSLMKMVSVAFSTSAPVTAGSVEKSNFRKVFLDPTWRSSLAPKLVLGALAAVYASSLRMAWLPRGRVRRTVADADRHTSDEMRPRQLVVEGTPAAEGLRAVTDESLVPSRLVVEQDR